MNPELRHRINDHLRSRGAIRRKDAIDLGLSDGDLAAMVARGELCRLREGAYVSTAVREGRMQQIREDVTSMGCDAYAARATALYLHDHQQQRIVPFERAILVGSLNGPDRPEPPTVHRTRSLCPRDLTIVADVPCTAPPRTVIDLAGQLRAVDRLSLLDRIIVMGLTTQEEMHARALALRNGRRGVVDLVEATCPDAAAVFFSKLERLGAPLLCLAGLDDVRFNVVPERCPDAGRCDAVSERYRVVVDWDGLRFHSTPEARQADNRKGNALVGRYHHVRFTWRDVMDRERYVVATVARARS